jgi:hypothetical protein
MLLDFHPLFLFQPEFGLFGIMGTSDLKFALTALSMVFRAVSFPGLFFSFICRPHDQFPHLAAAKSAKGQAAPCDARGLAVKGFALALLLRTTAHSSNAYLLIDIWLVAFSPVSVYTAQILIVP